MVSPQYYSHLEGKIRHFRKTGGYTQSEDGLSPSQSSDYEDQDEYTNCTQQIATVHVVSIFMEKDILLNLHDHVGIIKGKKMLFSNCSRATTDRAVFRI